jgi:hypothetical protein
MAWRFGFVQQTKTIPVQFFGEFESAICTMRKGLFFYQTVSVLLLFSDEKEK